MHVDAPSKQIPKMHSHTAGHVLADLLYVVWGWVNHALTVSWIFSGEIGCLDVESALLATGTSAVIRLTFRSFDP